MRKDMRKHWSIGFFLVLALLLAGACGAQQPVQEEQGNGDQPSGKPSGNQDSGTTMSETGSASSIEEAKNATIYIEAQGGLYDVGREFGELRYGSGSGFITSAEGLAVTNNHVVTGASYLNVYVEGDEEPHRATVLGTSECSDLALIDIEESGSLPFVNWRDRTIDSALSVNAIGYPAEDVPAGEQPDQTVTRGIINTTEASGELPWASVDRVIEHDATIRPGNSGGPLVDNEGKVVGINFAGDESERYLAVSRDESQALIQELRSADVTSIGISGEAYSDPDAGYSGILVAAVKTDSPAFEVGIQGLELDDETGEPTQFDVITALEGTILAEDETMNTYCEVLRAHEIDDPLTIEVERYEFSGSGDLTDFAVLDGVLNGEELKKNNDKTEERLEQLIGQTGQSSSASNTASGTGYTEVVDDTETLTMDVPTEWTDVRTSGNFIFEDEGVGPSMGASTNYEDWLASFDVPGAYLAASSSLAQTYPNDVVDRVLDHEDFSGSCDYDGRSEYSDSVYTGQLDIWNNCDGTSQYHVIAAVPEDRSFVVLLETTITSDADLEAEKQIINTFDVLKTP
jgi:serine protease Do